MTRSGMLVDETCYALAALRLHEESNKTVVMSLARAIQGAIEEWEDERLRETCEQAERDAEMRSLRGFDAQEIADKF